MADVPGTAPLAQQAPPAAHADLAINDRGWVMRMVEYAKMGAALVYHDVLAVQVDATRWADNNPALAGLIGKGVTYAVSLLAADGLPTRDAFLIAKTVEAALRELAANDPTINSYQPTAHQAPS